MEFGNRFTSPSLPSPQLVIVPQIDVPADALLPLAQKSMIAAASPRFGSFIPLFELERELKGESNTYA